MAPHSSTLAWKIPWAEEPGGLQSLGLQGTSLSFFTFMLWRRTQSWKLPGGRDHSLRVEDGSPSALFARLGRGWWLAP